MPTPPQQQPQTTTVTSPSLHFSDFLHCNNCFLLYTLAPNTDNTFYLIECSHVLCKACLKSGNGAPSDAGASGAANVPSDTCFTAFCPLCKDRYSFAELNDKLPQTIERFFKPAQELLDEAYETLQFQNRNLLGLVRYLNDKVAKQRKVLESAKEEIKKAVGYRKALHAVQEENKVLRAELTSGGDAGAEGAKRRRVPLSRSSESRSGGSEIRVASTSSSSSRIPLSQVSPNDQRQLHPPRTPNGPARLSLPAHGTSPAHDQARYQPYPPQPQQRYDGLADSGYAERGQQPVFNSEDVVVGRSQSYATRQQQQQYPPPTLSTVIAPASFSRTGSLSSHRTPWSQVVGGGGGEWVEPESRMGTGYIPRPPATPTISSSSNLRRVPSSFTTGLPPGTPRQRTSSSHGNIGSRQTGGYGNIRAGSVRKRW